MITMTVKRLEQYQNLKKEILELNEQKKQLESSAVVSGSAKEFPYIKHNIKVDMIENCDEAHKVISDGLKIARTEFCQLNKFINNINDSETRRIFRYRYVEGMTFKQIAFKIGKYEESYPRKKHNKYLKFAEKSESQVL